MIPIFPLLLKIKGLLSGLLWDYGRTSDEARVLLP